MSGINRQYKLVSRDSSTRTRSRCRVRDSIRYCGPCSAAAGQGLHDVHSLSEAAERLAVAVEVLDQDVADRERVVLFEPGALQLRQDLPFARAGSNEVEVIVAARQGQRYVGPPQDAGVDGGALLHFEGADGAPSPALRGRAPPRPDPHDPDPADSRRPRTEGRRRPPDPWTADPPPRWTASRSHAAPLSMALPFSWLLVAGRATRAGFWPYLFHSAICSSCERNPDSMRRSTPSPRLDLAIARTPAPVKGRFLAGLAPM